MTALLVWALLMTDVDAPAWLLLMADDFEGQCYRVARSEEWLSRGEEVWVNPELAGDEPGRLRALVKALRELRDDLEGSPYVCAVLSFGWLDDDGLQERQALAWSHRDRLARQAALYPRAAAELRAQIAEQDAALRAYRAVERARDATWTMRERRTRLRELRLLLGEDGFLGGQLPPPVPRAHAIPW